MPIILIIPCIPVAFFVSMLEKFHSTTVAGGSFLALGLILAARKAGKLTQLRKQAHNVSIATFAWKAELSPLEFEKWCADGLHLLGWAARTTKGSGDQGVDVIAKRDSQTIVIQGKKYNRPVGNNSVQEAFAAKAFTKANFAAVLTNTSSTKSALELAEATGVFLLTVDTRPNLNAKLNLPSPRLPAGSRDYEAEINQIMAGKFGAVILILGPSFTGVALLVDTHRQSPSGFLMSSAISAVSREETVINVPSHGLRKNH